MMLVPDSILFTSLYLYIKTLQSCLKHDMLKKFRMPKHLSITVQVEQHAVHYHNGAEKLFEGYEPTCKRYISIESIL